MLVIAVRVAVLSRCSCLSTRSVIGETDRLLAFCVRSLCR